MSSSQIRKLTAIVNAIDERRRGLLEQLAEAVAENSDEYSADYSAYTSSQQFEAYMLKEKRAIIFTSAFIRKNKKETEINKTEHGTFVM
jgi:hypothetical protein